MCLQHMRRKQRWELSGGREAQIQIGAPALGLCVQAVRQGAAMMHTRDAGQQAQAHRHSSNRAVQARAGG